MENYYVINVIKSEYFDCNITDARKDVYLLGVFEESAVRGKLRDYILVEKWDISDNPITGISKEEQLEQYIDEILNDKDFVYNNVGTTCSFIVENVKLNELREESEDNCILWYF